MDSNEKSPITVDLKKGQRSAFCTCGRSKGSPFCDGAHSGSCHRPLYMTAIKDGPAKICRCHKSNNFPFCDETSNFFCADDIIPE